MTQAIKKFYTPEEYFALEEKAQYKSEYHFGEILAMAGGSANHNRISRNVLTALTNAFKGKPCEAFGGDMKVEIEKNRLYLYPDLSIVCGKIAFAEGHNDMITNPVVIIEVLSESTENYDRKRKFAYYRRLASFKEYILIDQDEIYIETFYKGENGWSFDSIDRAEQPLKLQSIGYELSVTDIYDKVEFETIQG